MKLRTKKTILMLLTIILIASSFSILPLAAQQEEALLYFAPELMSEQIIDGRTVRIPMTREMEAAVASQELVDVGGVLVLVTTYCFGDGFEYEVFRFMQHCERGELSLLPVEQVVTSRHFEQALAEFYEERFGFVDYNSASSSDMGYQCIEATNVVPPSSASGRYSRQRMMNDPLPGNAAVWFDLYVDFNWHMRNNTNFGNPLWNWQRTEISGLQVRVLPWNDRPAQNLRSIVIDVVAITHGAPGISHSFSSSGSFSFSFSPGNNSRVTLVSREFTNSAGVVARIVDHGRWDLDRTVPYPLWVPPLNTNWVSLEVYGSFWLNSGFHNRLLRTGIRFNHNDLLFNPFSLHSYIP